MKNKGGISYPGDDGTEAPNVRECKANEYARKVEREAHERALAKLTPADRRAATGTGNWLQRTFGF